jgi:hypothetical protein
MEVLPTIAENAVDLSIYSPPFPELYQYSDDPRDMSNCVTYQEALDQYRYIVSEVERTTKPGRLSCVHCTDLKRGQLYQHDFPGDVIRIHESVGKRGFTHYAGGRQIPADLVRDFASYKGDPRSNLMSHWIYRQYASPVWMDIRRGRLLDFKGAREQDDEKHVCPLQMDVIERCLSLWSNPGEAVLTPFMGVGSEVYCAVANGRKAIGMELKETYYQQARRNLRAINAPEQQFALTEV